MVLYFHQVVKNLVFLAKVLHLLHWKTKGKLKANNNGEVIDTADQVNSGLRNHENSQQFALTSLMSKLGKMATREASFSPKKIQKVQI